jgi:hypothetical protein
MKGEFELSGKSLFKANKLFWKYTSGLTGWTGKSGGAEARSPL